MVLRIRMTSYNMFDQYFVNDNINRNISETLGRRSTRFYISFLVISLFILALYSTIQDQMRVINIPNPSLAAVQSLQVKYGDTLECPCTKIAIPYTEFMDVQPRFHQVRQMISRHTFHLFRNLDLFQCICD